MLPPLTSTLAVLALGAAPWFNDAGLLTWVGCIAWMWVCQRDARLATAVPVLASAAHLLWLPGTWVDGQGGSLLMAGLLWALLAVIQGLPGMLFVAVFRRLSPLLGPIRLALLAGMTLEGAALYLQVVPLQPAVLLADHGIWTWPAALGGRPLLTGVLLAVSTGLTLTPRPACAALALWAGIGAVFVRLPQPGVFDVGLVESGVHVIDARVPSNAEALQSDLLHNLRRLAREQPAFIATAEGAWLTDPGREPGARRDRFHRDVQIEVPVLLGATVGRDEPKSNAVLAVDGAALTSVDKRLLVPVWERSLLGIGHDRYTPGVKVPILEVSDLRVGVLLCYEDLFESELRRVSDADVLVLPSNDSWLGTSGRLTHLNAARLAAVSTGAWVVRPTLDGLSGFISPRGVLHAVSSAPLWPDGHGQTALQRIDRSHRHPGAQLGGVLPLLGGLALLLLWFRKRT